MRLAITEITVFHVWSKEERTLPVEVCLPNLLVYIRWGMAGNYSINLRTGVIRRMVPGKNGTKLDNWHVKDLNMVRDKVRRFYRDVHDTFSESFETHHRNMPKGDE